MNTSTLQLQQTKIGLKSQTDFLLNTDKCISMELQDVNLTIYCIPFRGVKATAFIPIASDTLMFISLHKKTCTKAPKNVYH
jgi:hypothetical protein